MKTCAFYFFYLSFIIFYFQGLRSNISCPIQSSYVDEVAKGAIGTAVQVVLDRPVAYWYVAVSLYGTGACWWDGKENDFLKNPGLDPEDLIWALDKLQFKNPNDSWFAACYNFNL